MDQVDLVECWLTCEQLEQVEEAGVDVFTCLHGSPSYIYFYEGKFKELIQHLQDQNSRLEIFVAGMPINQETHIQVGI